MTAVVEIYDLQSFKVIYFWININEFCAKNNASIFDLQWPENAYKTFHVNLSIAKLHNLTVFKLFFFVESFNSFWVLENRFFCSRVEEAKTKSCWLMKRVCQTIENNRR